jgi:hypothetical protein
MSFCASPFATRRASPSPACSPACREGTGRAQQAHRFPQLAQPRTERDTSLICWLGRGRFREPRLLRGNAPFYPPSHPTGTGTQGPSTGRRIQPQEISGGGSLPRAAAKPGALAPTPSSPPDLATGRGRLHQRRVNSLAPLSHRQAKPARTGSRPACGGTGHARYRSRPSRSCRSAGIWCPGWAQR